MQVTLCGFFFREFDTFDRQSASGFVTGLVVVMVGLVVTSRAPAPDKKKTELDWPPPEQHTKLPEISSAPPCVPNPHCPTSEPIFTPPTVIIPDPPGPDGSHSIADIIIVGELIRLRICYGGDYTELATERQPKNKKSRIYDTFKSVRLLAPLLEEDLTLSASAHF